MTKFLNISTDTTLGGNAPSDEVVASQKALKTYIDNNSGGGTVAIDGTTITKNSSDQIQAVATTNANVASAATNPIYDWVGTLAEYTSQAVATNHPDWVCFITDDDTAEAYDAYSKTQSDARYVQKAHEVIEFQAPTAQNNYTWYRKYADGWVEQGGQITNADSQTVTLPVVMQDANYQVLVTMGETGKNANYTINYGDRTTTGFNVYMSYSHTTYPSMWEVKGMMVA